MAAAVREAASAEFERTFETRLKSELSRLENDLSSKFEQLLRSHAPSPAPPPHAPAMPLAVKPSSPTQRTSSVTVRSAADAMMMAVRRKADVKLVEQRDAVLMLIERTAAIMTVELSSMDAAAKSLREISTDCDALSLGIEGKDWGERLLIKRKGGGYHFTDEERHEASRAHRRARLLHSSVTWHERLVGGAQQVATLVRGFRSAAGGGTALSRLSMIERCGAHLEVVKKTISDICGDEYVAAALREMRAEAIPQTVAADADTLRQATLLLASFVHEQAVAELAGYRTERSMTQRFRATQTIAVLSAAKDLLIGIKAEVGAEKLPRSYLQEINDGIAEVQPVVDLYFAEDEIDDEI
ncbi:hypothetical protein AB1Y20_004632 [Prymnesium parvum]|uniref:Uncharacterized protein n=1 Tax=Prymnesium parvum TaxID=97485 RepID=A0AB34IXK7_PRYPA